MRFQEREFLLENLDDTHEVLFTICVRKNERWAAD